MVVGKKEAWPSSDVPLRPAGRLHGALQAQLWSFEVLR